MMIQEFEARTGIYPSLDLYAAIEAAYAQGDDDKDAFCTKYKKNTGGLAERIQRAANKVHFAEADKTGALIRERDDTIERLEREVERLKAALEKEMEWHPARNVGTNMSEKDYTELLACCQPGQGDPKIMSEVEAAELVAEEFGFNIDAIRIITEVAAYEANRHGLCRVAGKYTRQPLYNATDWNYVRFNVATAGGTFSWEMVNGELREYSC